MREIKFRAWDIERLKYLPPETDFITWPKPSNWRDFYEVEQFTGLQDKNGRDIYEGDIVHFPGAVGRDTFKVVFYMASFNFAWGNGTVSQPFWPFIVGNPCEIIGNIHDNPELLK